MLHPRHWLLPGLLGLGACSSGIAELPPDLESTEAGWRHAASGIVLLRVEPGSYVMGSPDWEVDRDGDEPQRKVSIDEPFLLGETEITVGQWRRVMNQEPPLEQTQDDHPVKGVTWYAAQEFVAKLNAEGPGGWRLPTEEEWEYACRAGTTGPFSFEALTPEVANYRGRSPYAGGEKGLDRGDVIPVKSFAPNPWGFYDMHGNVWEWCEDVYLVHPGRTRVPTEPGASRTMRGGAFTSKGKQLRSAYRDGYPPQSTGPKYGFRVARSLD